MVGEIRERETAEIAVQAALTGHLVLSTLHTNDSIGAITRMLDMGVPAYLLSSALIGVLAQRLIRTICPACRTSYTASVDALAEYGIQRENQTRLYKGKGCPVCYDSGYKGRIAIHEVFGVDNATQELMVSNPSRDIMLKHMRERGIATLFDSGIENVLQGHTTIDEVMRVSGSAYGN
jgi:type II secretory ATPase GspE/PulE/Tfp pilus assembly ATPase PilB-like protein